MKCPYCKTEFKLTWKRSFGGFYECFSVHRCPSCNRQSILSFSGKYLLSLLWGPGLAGALSALLGSIIFSSFNAAIISATVIGIPVGVSIDKRNSERYRKLHPFDFKDRYKIWLQVIATVSMITIVALLVIANLTDEKNIHHSILKILNVR